MKLRLALLTITVLLTLPAHAAAQVPADAYVNEEARELVRQARLRRATVDRRIEAYGTTARERFTVALRAGIAEKLVYRRETATRIDWERDGAVHMEVLGMREIAPIITSKVSVPQDISAELLRLSFDPVGSDLFLRLDTVGLRHPLFEGAEAHYRYQAGDTTVITLPDGRAVRLLELRIIPRRREMNLMSGSFWLESESHAVVRIYVRPARGFDADRGDGRVEVAQADADSGGGRSITLNTIAGFAKPVRAEVEYIAIEYGLWEMHWWMPRRLAAQGFVQVSGMRVPLSYERTYEDYTIRGDTSLALSPADTLPLRRCAETVRFTVTTPQDSARQAKTTSERERRERSYAAARARRGDTTSVGDCTREFVLSAPSDSILLHSEELPPSPFGSDIALIPEDELRAIIDRMRDVPAPPFRTDPLRFEWGYGGPGLLRYNRVEGLSVGARLILEAEPWRFDITPRFSTADREVRGEVGLQRRFDAFIARAAAYRRVRTAHPVDEVPGIWGGVGALLLGRDDVEYYDAAGAELVVRPPDAAAQWYDMRFYAERQRAVERNTDFSVAHLINSRNTFSDNFTADAADQIGARLRLRTAFGRNPRAPRIAGELSLGGETGDYTIFRPEATLRLNTPLVTGLSFGIEGAAGTVEGAAIPAQALWRLGGSSTLRGYAGSAIIGERYWRTRAELGAGIAGARLTLFSDAGWAGSRNAFTTSGALYSIGVGGSFLDGLVRLDLARAMREPRGWRLHLHFNGM